MWINGFWQPGFWVSGFWEGDAPVIPPTEGSLDPLAIAVQGVGFSALLVALQGFDGVEIEVRQRGGSSKAKQLRKQVKNDDDEIFEIISMILYEMC